MDYETPVLIRIRYEPYLRDVLPGYACYAQSIGLVRSVFEKAKLTRTS